MSFNYLTDLDSKYIDHVPEEFRATITELWPINYGAYIFQDPADPSLYGSNSSKCYSAKQVIRLLEHMARNVCNIDSLDSDSASFAELSVLGEAFTRLADLNTIYTVSSLLKYYFMVVKMRTDAKSSYDKDELRETKNYDSNWMLPDDVRIALLQESFSDRKIKALKFVGNEMHHPILDEDFAKVSHDDSVDGRLAKLFQSPRYRAFYEFYYMKSEKGNVDSVTWLTRKAHNLVSAVIKEHGQHVSSEEVKSAIDVYTASMRTSTTGCVLKTETSLYAPKSVEGDRLLTNLFKHHLKQILKQNTHDFLNACLMYIPTFIERGKRNSRVRESFITTV